MRTIRLIFWGCIISLPTLSLAAPVLGEQALRLECSNAYFSQAEVWDCLAEKVESSQKTLRQAEKRVLNEIPRWDEDKKYRVQARANLLASNKEFARYRESHCRFQASLGGGAIGSALDLRRFACIAELNNRRAAQLRDSASDLARWGTGE